MGPAQKWKEIHPPRPKLSMKQTISMRHRFSGQRSKRPKKKRMLEKQNKADNKKLIEKEGRLISYS